MKRASWIALPGLCGVALALASCAGGDAGTRTPTAAATPVATRSSGTPAAASPTGAARGEVRAGAYRAEPALALTFERMTELKPIPGDEGHGLLLTKDGVVRFVALMPSDQNPSVFMDIRDRIITNPGQEEGLLGLAFAPDFATSRRFYLYYTAGNPRRSVISRFTADATGTSADASSERVVLEIGEPFANHNGGAMAFGPDGMLYIGVGDGGSQGDPNGNGQNTDVLLGKILRIDVSGDAYTSPSDNPFANGGRPEVWAYGLRNPWRINFDPVTGALWAADVGQNKWEEVDRIERGGNYGWNVMEGNHCFKPSSGCDTHGLIPPRVEYSHDDGCSITGGYVYRGRAMPELQGWYVYGDFCSGKVWAVDTASPDAPPVQLASTKLAIASFAQDADGELYLVTFSRQVAKLVRAE